MGEVDSKQEEVGTERGEMEALRKGQREVLEMENTVVEMRTAFDGPG